MIGWLDLLRANHRQAPLAMVSVLATEGSAPRGGGTRMLVGAETAWGTIGGGALEWQALAQARALLDHPPGSWRVQDYPLGPMLGQCCGGRVRLLVEHIDPERLGWLTSAEAASVLITRLGADTVERRIAQPGVAGPVPGAMSARGARPVAGAEIIEVIGAKPRPVYLFGAGHVGQAIARHIAGLPLRLCWFDTRPVFESIEGVAIVPEAAIAQCVAEAPADAALLVLTHDHALDYRLTLAALQGEALAFIGLIGSATKRARFLSRLERDGVGPTALARLTCPIGMAGVIGKEPDVIAIAVLAQLLQLAAAVPDKRCRYV